MTTDKLVLAALLGALVAQGCECGDDGGGDADADGDSDGDGGGWDVEDGGPIEVRDGGVEMSVEGELLR